MKYKIPKQRNSKIKNSQETQAGDISDKLKYKIGLVWSDEGVPKGPREPYKRSRDTNTVKI